MGPLSYHFGRCALHHGTNSLDAVFAFTFRVGVVESAMRICSECNSLVGQPTSAVPHESLLSSARKMQPYGLVEEFTCKACGTHLERFRATLPWRHAPQIWEIRSAAGPSIGIR